MKQELETKLQEDFPSIFPQSDQFYGIGCGDGWYDLIHMLCEDIITYQDKENPVEATQVKEKFGGLRFYISGGNDAVYDLITIAEDVSYTMCEMCGSKNDVHLTKGGWIKTLCSDCDNK